METPALPPILVPRQTDPIPELPPLDDWSIVPENATYEPSMCGLQIFQLYTSAGTLVSQNIIQFLTNILFITIYIGPKKCLVNYMLPNVQFTLQKVLTGLKMLIRV